MIIKKINYIDLPVIKYGLLISESLYWVFLLVADSIKHLLIVSRDIAKYLMIKEMTVWKNNELQNILIHQDIVFKTWWLLERHAEYKKSSALMHQIID